MERIVKRQKVLFIAGAVRSGSTLLAQALGGLPGFVSAGEVKYVFSRGMGEDQLCGCGMPFSTCPFWQKVAPDPLTSAEIAQLTHGIRAASRFRSGLMRTLGLRPRGSHDRSRSLDVALTTTYRHIGRQGGQNSVVVDSSKSIPYLTYLMGLPELDITVLHLVRDPRSVANSLSRRKVRPEIEGSVSYMRQETPFFSTAMWTAKNMLMEIVRLMNRDLAVRRIRYEDIVRDPGIVLVDIATQFGRTPDDVERLMVDRHLLRISPSHSVSGNPMRFETGDVAIRQDTDWTSGLTRIQSGVISLMAAPLMTMYGYCCRMAERVPIGSSQEQHGS